MRSIMAGILASTLFLGFYAAADTGQSSISHGHGHPSGFVTLPGVAFLGDGFVTVGTGSVDSTLSTNVFSNYFPTQVPDGHAITGLRVTGELAGPDAFVSVTVSVKRVATGVHYNHGTVNVPQGTQGLFDLSDLNLPATSYDPRFYSIFSTVVHRGSATDAGAVRLHTVQILHEEVLP